MDFINLLNINIILAIYIISLFNIKNIHSYNLYFIFISFILFSIYFIYNQSYFLMSILFISTIFNQPNYTIFFDFILIFLLSLNLYLYNYHNNNFIDIYSIFYIIIIQYSILFSTNIFFKKYIKFKYPALEIYTHSIIGSNLFSWSLFTISLFFIYSSLNIKNVLGYFIILCQFFFNPNNPDKQFRSIPNQLITIFMDIYSKFKQEYINYSKEQIINNKIYKIINNNNNNNNNNKLKYKLEIGDIIELKKDDIVPFTIFINNQENINVYISTIQIDGEKNLKLKKSNPHIDINDFINDNTKNNKNNINDYIYNDNLHIIRKNAIIKNNVIVHGKIININKQNITIPKIFELDSIIKNIELIFLFFTIVLFFFNLFLGFIHHKEFNYQNLIQYFLGIQMINPMSISSIIFIILSNINKNYINYNGKKQIAASFNNNKFINKFIHCSDKTGTLTSNKFNYYTSLFNSNADKSKLNEYIIRCSSNTLTEPNIIPEEEEYFKKLNIHYTHYDKYNGFVIKNNIYKQIFFGFIPHFKAVFSLNLFNNDINDINYNNNYINDINYNNNDINDINYNNNDINYNKKSKYYILIQCGEEYANIMDKNIPNLEYIYKYCNENNINITSGAPRIWYILKSNEIEFDINTINIIIEKYKEYKNNPKKLIPFINKLLLHFKINYYSCQIMSDEYRLNVRDMIFFNKINNIPFIIITGDNYNASKRISDDLKLHNTIFLDKNQQLDFINNSLNIDFVNSNVICFSSEAHIKQNIIKKLKNFNNNNNNNNNNKYKYKIIYSGDGKNDILALDEADISIGFKDNNDEIDDEIMLVSGIIADKNFWNYYINKFMIDGNEIRNKLSKSIKLLIIKQTSVCGMMLGYYIKNKYEDLSEPFKSSEYLMYQILSFMIIISSFYVNNHKVYYIKNKDLILESIFTLFLNIVFTYFISTYKTLFIINLIIMLFVLKYER